MTIITKPSTTKTPDGKLPLVTEDWRSEETKVNVVFNRDEPEVEPETHSAGSLLGMTVVALVVVVMGTTCGLMLYRQYLRTGVHFKSYCTIPLDTKELQEPQEQLIEPNYRDHRVIPLPWSAGPLSIVSVGEDDTSNDFVDSIREELDIDDQIEKVRVHDKGKSISFIHDFTDNTTAIVDNERCFVMDLNRETTLDPNMFVMGIQNGDKFDVSRVRNTVRALLPALKMLSGQAEVFAQLCLDKPVYRLVKEEKVHVVRKRCADTAVPNYIHFAGKHVQEIQITNLPRLLQHEKHE